MYLAKTKKPSLGRVAVSAFHNNSDCKVSNMECDPHRLTPSRRCDQPPAVRAAPCIYRTTVFQQIAASVSSGRGERSNAAPAGSLPPYPQGVCHIRKAAELPTAVQCAARAALRATDCQCKRGRGARPLVLSLRGLRGILSFEKENTPFLCTPARRGNSSPLCERHYSLFGSGSPASESRYRYSGISSRKPARTSSLSSGVNSTPSGLSS